MKPYKIPGTIIWFQGFNLTFYNYIIEANKPDTAVVLKEIIEQDGTRYKAIIKLIISKNDSQYKNYVITFMRTKDKEWRRLLRNKRILYRKS